MATTFSLVFISSFLLLSASTAVALLECAPKDIFIGQVMHQDPFGRNRYTVYITNIGYVPMTNILVSCNDFNPMELIMKKPGLFAELKRGYCLVNEGRVIDVGKGIRFDYIADAKARLYPISVKCF